jgi:hypothetical protein
MSTTYDNELLQKISELPLPAKYEVAKFIDEKRREQKPTKPRKCGFGKDAGFTVVIHDDFDEPLEELKPYTI